MADNIIISCLYDFRVHCDFYNAFVKTSFKETCPNRLCQFDLIHEKTYKNAVIYNLKMFLVKSFNIRLNHSKHLWL